ncbi:MAG: type II toxin-antitoxin system death-on-curing family toxin [Steroidobacteraceae bacterium]
MHAELISEHGGLAGPVRIAELEAALGRPQHQFSYSDSSPSLERLAAAYGYSLARNHCFADGNKRIALAVIDVFLQMNGRELTAEEVDAAEIIQFVAAGKLTEEQLAAWISEHARSWCHRAPGVGPLQR